MALPVTGSDPVAMAQAALDEKRRQDELAKLRQQLALTRAEKESAPLHKVVENTTDPLKEENPDIRNLGGMYGAAARRGEDSLSLEGEKNERRPVGDMTAPQGPGSDVSPGNQLRRDLGIDKSPMLDRLGAAAKDMAGIEPDKYKGAFGKSGVPTRPEDEAKTPEQNYVEQQQAAAGMGGPAAKPMDYKALAWQALGRSPETQGRLDEADEAIKGAVSAAAEHGAMTAASQAGYQRQYRHELERDQAREIEEAQRNQELQQSALQRIDAVSAAVHSEEVDPNRLWNSMSTPGKILATVGIAIGAGLNAKTGHGNPALDVLDREINRDIQAQVANMANKEGRVHDMMQIYPMLRQQGLDDFSSRTAARMMGRDIFLNKLQTVAAMGQSKEIRDRAQLTIAEIQKRQAMDQAALEAAINQMAFKLQYSGGKGGGDGADLQAIQKFTDSLDKNKIPDTVAALDEADQNMNTLGKGDIPGIGWFSNRLPLTVVKFLEGDEAAANQQTFAAIKAPIRQQISGVAINPQEEAFLNRMLEGAEDPESLRRTIERMRHNAELKYNNHWATLGPRERAYYLQNGGLPPPEAGHTMGEQREKVSRELQGVPEQKLRIGRGRQGRTEE